MRKPLIILLFGVFAASACMRFGLKKEPQKSPEVLAETWVEELLKPAIYPENLRRLVSVDTLWFRNAQFDSLNIELSRLSQRAYFRETQVKEIEDAALQYFSAQYNELKHVDIRIRGNKLSYFVPNAFRSEIPIDSTRLQKYIWPEDHRVVKKRYQEEQFLDSGLKGRNIALWNSHGWYYEEADDRWKFQRARLWQTVEDLYPTRYVLNYLMPMLENAGAQVWLPRERGVYPYELIIDDPDFYEFSGKHAPEVIDSGFALGDTLIYGNMNPFEEGTSLKVDPLIHGNANFVFQTVVQEEGIHPLYIAYPKLENASDHVLLTVETQGIKRVYQIDQTKAFKTWVHIDDLYFAADSPLKITLQNDSTSLSSWGWDAFRIGGGIGTIVRGGRNSGRPRFVEGSRYWLQYAGFPDSLVYDFRPENRDYVDDYVSRGEWVNFLMGGPTGANQNRSIPGLDVPIDLSLAFHTDAGTDTAATIGTLLIYSTSGADSKEDTLYDGSHRVTNRDLSDITQTEIVQRTRQLWMPDWQRRGLWDRRYSEAFRPNVPAMLLELLSHHNEVDMRLGLEPDYRFDASRAIYIGILKYLGSRHGFEPIVQPLPVKNLRLTQSVYRDSLSLSWEAIEDPLEPTANPNYFEIEISSSELGNFRVLETTSRNQIHLSKKELQNDFVLRIRALNAGGRSMPSRLLSFSLPQIPQKKVLLVNAFDRREGPTRYRSGERILFSDGGMSDGIDPGFIGRVKNTLIADTWMGNSGHTNDEPGFGASASTYEAMATAGNTGFHMRKWAEDLKSLNIESHSISKSEFAKLNESALKEYDQVFIIGAAQRTSVHPVFRDSIRFNLFDSSMVQQLERLSQYQIPFLVNAAYVGQELQRLSNDSLLYGRLSNLLGIRLIAKDAQDLNLVKGAAPKLGLTFNHYWSYTNKPNSYNYYVDDLNAIGVLEGLDGSFQKATVLLRTAENELPVMIQKEENAHRVISASLPIELIREEDKRRELIKWIVDQL